MAIYDCFSFFNEVDVLKLRLEMMDPIVDHFVIVEMNKTFRGEDKPYNFLKHKSEFSKYLHKITYINPDNIPEYKGDNDWTLENYSRNSIMKGLTNCEPDDIIIVSDLDEIPNPLIFKNPNEFEYSKFPDRSFKKIIKLIIKNKSFWLLKHTNNWLDLLEYTPVACQQRMYHYYLNCRSKTPWYGTVICKYKNLKTTQYLRKIRGSIPYVLDSGWHMSYFGGVGNVKEKLKTIIDDNKKLMDITKQRCDDDAFISNCLTDNKDIYGRSDAVYDYSSFDELEFPNKKEILQKYPIFFNNQL